MAAKYAKDQPEGFVNRIERVAIIGAGGQLGRRITESLVATGQHTITVLTRTDSKTTLPDGVQAVPVDYDNEETLVSALRGQQFLIVTLSIHAAPDTHGKIIRAAAKAGVQHVMPNVYTCDIVLNNAALGDEVMMRGMHTPTIQDMESQGLAYTVLVCGLWYEFSLACPPDFLGFDIAKREVVLFDEGNHQVNMSTWTQLGRGVAAFLSLKLLPEDENDTSPTVAGYRNKPLYVSSFHASQRDILASVMRVTGTTESDWKVTTQSSDERVAEGMRQVSQGNLLGMATAYYSRMFSQRGQDAVFEGKLDNGRLGLGREDMDEATGRAVGMVEDGWNPHQ